MVSQKKIGDVLIFIGIIIFILALLVDFIGLGSNVPLISETWYPGIGYKQISGFIAATILIILGFYLKQLGYLLFKIQTMVDRLDYNSRSMLVELSQLQKKVAELESKISQ